MRVLLIEDDPAEARRMDKALRDEGIELTAFDSLASASGHIDTSDVDAIIVDLCLRETSGMDAVQTLHERELKMPVVAMAPADDRGVAVEALRRGAEDVVSKGAWEPVLLARAIRQAQERHRLHVRLQRSNEDLQQFAYVASHDLQEPLRMIKSYLQLLAKRYQGRLDQDADEFIAYAVDGAERMQRLIDDLLTYARVQTKGRDFATADCEEALAQALAALQLAIDESGGAVTHDPLPTISGDAVQIGQLLQNLIGNALKFRPADRPPNVHVSAERQEGAWRFAVRDNGIGLPQDRAESAFAIFTRLHGKNDYPGTGIGLAVCKRIVERHGGRIWLESEPGEGATFYFTIPDRPAEARAAA